MINEAQCVELNNIEVIQGALVGCMRTIRGKGFNDDSRERKKEKNVSQWHIDIEGACAEIAFAKGRGLYWTGVFMDTFKAGDVGDVQVRQTDLLGGGLILRPNDSDSSKFALVVGSAPKFYIIGWLLAGTGKRAEFLRGENTDEPYWLVPQTVMMPFQG